MNTDAAPDSGNMRLGITGTREGCSEAQLEELFNLMQELKPHVESFHHGDCVGVDGQAALIATELGMHTTCHPPTNPDHRAWHASDVTLEPKGYIERDKDIVDAVDIMVVVPLADNLPRSGTWTTHRYAVRQGVPRIVIHRDGTVERQQ